MKSLRVLISCALAVCAGGVQAQDDLTALDLETLMTMDVTITSAARHAQAIAEAPAAVYVLTRDDLRRSGALSLPQALRYVPGLQVARISPRGWSVSARGFGTRFSNKLLVLVDGRSIYNALFSGVLWEEQPVPFDNIERIEVIRGPGGALWGMNAVNGVINIITRTAADARGAYAEFGAGSFDRVSTARYGAEIAGVGAVRAFVMHDELDAYDSDDASVRNQGGVRFDRDAFGGLLTFDAAAADAKFSDHDSGLDAVFSKHATTGNVGMSWTRSTRAGAVELRGFYGWVERSTPLNWDESTLGLDAQFSTTRIGRHIFTAGGGLRRLSDEQRGDIPIVELAVKSARQDQWSVYAQDEVFFARDAVRVTVGGKLENFEYTGSAFEPTLRALWKYNDAHTFWTAASRALRSPSRVELHLDLQTQIEQSPPLYYNLVGDDSLREEELRAYELGWRWRPQDALSFDVALYRNDYSHLIGSRDLPPVLDPGPPPRFFVARQMYSNLMDARTRGVEIAAEWQALPSVRLQASGAWFDVEHTSSAAAGVLSTSTGLIDPEHAVSLRARLDVRRDVELDLGVRSVGAMPGYAVDAYEALDARVAWRVTPAMELSLTIENALAGRHVEFEDEIADGPGVRVERSAMARFIWRPEPATRE